MPNCYPSDTKVGNKCILYHMSETIKITDTKQPLLLEFWDIPESKKFESFLLRKGFFVLPWPDIPKAVADSCPIHYKQVKVVPFIW